MTGKEFNVFDECASRCVCLSPYKEGFTLSSWGDCKMYTSDSIASSLRLPTEINESDAIDKIRISVESDTVKCLKAFRIISSKMPISLLILNNILVACIFRYFFLLSYQPKMFFQISVFKVYRSVVLKHNSLWKVDRNNRKQFSCYKFSLNLLKTNFLLFWHFSENYET